MRRRWSFRTTSRSRPTPTRTGCRFPSSRYRQPAAKSASNALSQRRQSQASPAGVAASPCFVLSLGRRAVCPISSPHPYLCAAAQAYGSILPCSPNSDDLYTFWVPSPRHHSQAKARLEAGFLADEINIPKETLVFRRGRPTLWVKLKLRQDRADKEGHVVVLRSALGELVCCGEDAAEELLGCVGAVGLGE